MVVLFEVLGLDGAVGLPFVPVVPLGLFGHALAG